MPPAELQRSLPNVKQVRKQGAKRTVYGSLSAPLLEVSQEVHNYIYQQCVRSSGQSKDEKKETLVISFPFQSPCQPGKHNSSSNQPSVAEHAQPGVGPAL